MAKTKKALSRSRYVTVTCTTCKKKFKKLRKELHKQNFCCFKHFVEWNAKRISKFDTKKNRMNKKGGWKLEERLENRNRQLEKCECKNIAYKKYLGRHLHRVVAEKMLGRPLKDGEVVHHIDGNKFNNNPKNLLITTRKEHARIHANERWGHLKSKKGDIYDNYKK